MGEYRATLDGETLAVTLDEDQLPGEPLPEDVELTWRGEPVTEAHFAELLRRECGGEMCVAGRLYRLVAVGDRVRRVSD